MQGNYRPISLMNINVKNQNKILAYQTRYRIFKKDIMIKLKACEDGLAPEILSM